MSAVKPKREQVTFGDTTTVFYNDTPAEEERSLSVEDKIRIQADSSRFRVQEFFIDYDRLRSGFVTRSQFQRILDQELDSPLSQREIEYLLDKYDTKKNNTVNYRLFCNNINISVPEKNLKGDPSEHVYQSPEYLGTIRSMKKLDKSEQKNLDELLSSMNSYYRQKNLDIFANFRDFDRNNIGTLTINQFRRALCEPPLSESEIQLIIRKYQHPEKPETINYLNFYNDVKSSYKDENTAPFIVPNENRSSISYNKSNGLISVQEIIDKITIASYKFGIRVVDAFKDYDRLRSGTITDRQFQTGLTLSIQKQADLSTNEIGQLTEYYRLRNGKCDYRSFCDTIESAFNVPELEKKPLTVLNRPPRGILSKTLNGTLTPDEEDMIANTLADISEKVRRLKIQLFPFFKDFDRSTAFTRNITKTQFGRVLSTLSLMPPNKEYQLLCKKFEDPVTGDVNYPVFCQAVEEDYVASIIDEIPDLSEEEIKEKLSKKGIDDFQMDITKVDINEVMGRIRNHVLGKRLRVKEFFQDMDPLNSGYISKAQFIRCLSMLGVSSLGAYNISKIATEALCNAYRHPEDPKRINWHKFEFDVESVFTLKDLEKNPNARVADSSIFLMPPPGTLKWDEKDNLNNSESFQNIMDKWKLVVNQKRIDCWPPFKDFDKLNHGHVTVKQFHQCLSRLSLPYTSKELAIVEAKYVNDVGFNYYNFLNNLQPNEVEAAKYLMFKQELEQLNSKKLNYEVDPLTDVQSLLIKIKDKVFKRRVSIYEWLRDHDKLNSGRLLRETFKRAINLTNLELEPSEIELLMNYYGSKNDPRYVHYKTFCREIEQAFSNDELEKNPLLEIEQHAPKHPIHLNKLSPNDEELVESSLAKIAERVKKERIQLFPRFEDFDRVKNGFVSQNQFKRVLNDLNLMKMLNDYELRNLMSKYAVKVGTRDDVNYLLFADKVYELGSFEYRNP